MEVLEFLRQSGRDQVILVPLSHFQIWICDCFFEHLPQRPQDQGQVQYRGGKSGENLDAGTAVVQRVNFFKLFVQSSEATSLLFFLWVAGEKGEQYIL